MDGGRLSGSTAEAAEADSTTVTVVEGGGSAAEVPSPEGAEAHSASRTNALVEEAVSTQQVMVSEQVEEFELKQNPSVKFSDGRADDSSQSERLPMSPHPGKQVLLQQQYEGFLYADGRWHVCGRVATQVAQRAQRS
jgi:hypothetical protein